MTLPVIEAAELFPEERAALLELLEGLTPEEWQRPTVCPGWSVKDIVLHLLGDDVGMISSWRDGHLSPHFADGLDIATWEGLLAAIDRQNAQWIDALRRMSAPLLLQMLRFTGAEFAEMVREIDPQRPAGPVDWAGPGPAPAWMHLAREYTEYWIHQQQIRDAVGRPGLTGRRHLHPVLDAFARALPHALRDHHPADGAIVRLVVTGAAGGAWTAQRCDGVWTLTDDHATPATTTVTLDQELAWRLFTKGVRPDDVRSWVIIAGDPALAVAVLAMVTILA